MLEPYRKQYVENVHVLRLTLSGSGGIVQRLLNSSLVDQHSVVPAGHFFRRLHRFQLLCELSQDCRESRERG